VRIVQQVAQTVAEELGVDLEMVCIRPTNSLVTPNTTGTFESSTSGEVVLVQLCL
jgi:xanthine dehydrogenase molybdopterin-binding subunit B